MNPKSTSSRLTSFRTLVLLIVACLLAPALFIAARAAGMGIIAGGLVCAVALALLLLGVKEVIPESLASNGERQRVLFGVWMVLNLIAAYQLAGLSVFMLDSTKTDYAINPTIRTFADPDMEKPFFLKHNCFTSYIIGAHLAGEDAENIFDPEHYRDAEEPTAIHKVIGERHTIDTYQYPPPFLILPKLLLATGGDFFQVRTYWYALNILCTVLTIAALVLWLGGKVFNVYWLALPLVLLSPNTQGTWQIGNAHFLIICLALLGMLAFARKRNALGGLLLGFAIVSKIFPGVLLAYLVVRRSWRAVGWTIAAMTAYAFTALLIFGDKPYRAFIDYQLPRLASGDAFWFAREHIRAILVNLSVMGTVYKLHTLDLLGQLDPAPIAGAAMWLFTAALLFCIFALGQKHHQRASNLKSPQPDDRLALVRVWVVLLILGQLRSPFLPWDYGSILVILLMALFAPTGARWIGRTVLLLLGWFMFSIHYPLAIGSESVSVDLSLSLFASLIAIAMCFLAVRHESRRCATIHPPPPTPSDGPCAPIR